MRANFSIYSLKVSLPVAVLDMTRGSSINCVGDMVIAHLDLACKMVHVLILFLGLAYMYIFIVVNWFM